MANKTFLVIVICLLTTTATQAAPLTKQQKQIDTSIVKALAYLAEQQVPSGAWKIDAFGESTASTSMAVMAFMAAGHVPGEGPYGEKLERGVKWVIDHQEQNGLLVHRRSHGPMYSHGISALMLAEVVGMVSDDLAKPCRKALVKAIKLIIDAQNISKPERHAGGWRYQPLSKDSDLSVSAWQLLALRAAKNSGCDVPAENIKKAVAYIKLCRDQSQRGFAYQPGGGSTPTRTGTGILALEICGEHHAPESIVAADFLLEKPLDEGEYYFYYGVYYCTVGMFKMGGKYWDKTRDNVVTLLLGMQNPDGSWQAKKGSERNSGKVYATSMSVLALAVEYQFLPIYQR